MLIVPLTGRLNRENFPWLTLSLILVNCFVFIVFQSSDSKNFEKALGYYLKSGLAGVECTRYVDYLKSRNRLSELSFLKGKKKYNQNDLLMIYSKMKRDDEFMDKLLAGRIITPGEKIYPWWKVRRDNYRKKLSRVVGYHYAFIPAEPRAVSLVTHMFLHGSFMHLFGNMLFLWLVGSVVEAGWNKFIYLPFYLLTGVAAVFTYCLFNLHSHIPLLGASGAISGLVGAMMVSYGRARIKVFYSLGFYFDYKRIPAIILLPAWILKEIFQLFFSTFSNVAYMAHVGGLVAGSAIGYFNVKVLKMVDEDVFKEEPSEKVAHLFELALKKMETLHFEEARELLKEVLKIEPNNEKALSRLYRIERQNPGSEEYRLAAKRYMSYLWKVPSEHGQLLKVYTEYTRISSNPGIEPELLHEISMAFVRSGYLKDAEKIMALFLKKNPAFKMLPVGLLKLGQGYLKTGKVEKGLGILRLVRKRFPHTSESKIAGRLLCSSRP